MDLNHIRNKAFPSSAYPAHMLLFFLDVFTFRLMESNMIVIFEVFLMTVLAVRGCWNDTSVIATFVKFNSKQGYTHSTMLLHFGRWYY
jgi:hypothetical protein